MARSGKYVVYAIDGSSRQRTGQTEKRLTSLLRRFPKTEVSHELIRLTDPKRTDDIDRLLNRIENADGIIFGTPTYWFNMSARVKNLLERLVVTENHDEYSLEGIVAGFVATGDAKEDGAMIALSSIAATVNHLGMITFPYSMIYFRGKSGPSWAEAELRDFPKRMLKMMKFGRFQRKKGW